METYTIGRAADLLGVSTDTARRWADADRFPTRREGRGRMADGPGVRVTARVRSTSPIDRG